MGNMHVMQALEDQAPFSRNSRSFGTLGACRHNLEPDQLFFSDGSTSR